MADTRTIAELATEVKTVRDAIRDVLVNYSVIESPVPFSQYPEVISSALENGNPGAVDTIVELRAEVASLQGEITSLNKSHTDEIASLNKSHADEIASLNKSHAEDTAAFQTLVTGSGTVVPSLSSYTTLRSGFLYGCPSVTGVTIPASVTSVAKDMLYGSSVTHVTMTGRTRAQVRALQGFPFGLPITGTFTCSDGDMDATGYYDMSSEPGVETYLDGTAVIAPSGARWVPATWAGRTDVFSVNLGEDVSGIADAAFKNCTMIETVTDDSGGSGSDIVIGDESFHGCSSLLLADLARVTAVGDRAFYGCSSLPSADLTNVTVVGDRSFYGCGSLETVRAPKCVSVGPGAFYNDTALTSVNLQSVNTLSKESFYGCSGLVSITAPRCVELGESALRGCRSLGPCDFVKCTKLGANALNGCSASVKDLNITTLSYAAPDALAGAVFNGGSLALPSDTIGVFGYTANGANSVSSSSLDSPKYSRDNYFDESKKLDTVTILYAGDTVKYTLFFRPKDVWVYNVHTWKTPAQDDLQYSVSLTGIQGSVSIETLNFEYGITVLEGWCLANVPTKTVVAPSVDTITGTISCASIDRVTINHNNNGDEHTHYDGHVSLSSTAGSFESSAIIKSYAADCLKNFKRYVNKVYTMNQIKNVANYPWGLGSGATIVCKDGTITL